MSRRPLLLAAGGLLIYAAWQFSQDNSASSDATATDAGASSGSDVFSTLQDAATSALEYVGFSMWSPDKVPVQYRDAIASAEMVNGIPQDMLARLLYQESHYRPDIINGTKTSPVGALGIAQFMPATAAQFGINALDPFQSISAAGKYLGQLYRQFGSWDKALAAYNWGPGNVKKKGIALAPTETKNYFSQILADLGMSGGTVA